MASGSGATAVRAGGGHSISVVSETEAATETGVRGDDQAAGDPRLADVISGTVSSAHQLNL
jgi:hypothetical protein